MQWQFLLTRDPSCSKSVSFKLSWSCSFSIGQCSWAWELKHPQRCFLFKVSKNYVLPPWSSPQSTCRHSPRSPSRTSPCRLTSTFPHKLHCRDPPLLHTCLHTWFIMQVFQVKVEVGFTGASILPFPTLTARESRLKTHLCYIIGISGPFLAQTNVNETWPLHPPPSTEPRHRYHCISFLRPANSTFPHINNLNLAQKRKCHNMHSSTQKQ